MTFSAIRLPVFKSLHRTAPPQAQTDTADHVDFRREYIERLMSSDACISDCGAQALMGLFPRDF